MKPTEMTAKEDAMSSILGAMSTHESDLSNWNGDNDGPQEKAYDRLQKNVSEALDKFEKSMSTVKYRIM